MIKKVGLYEINSLLGTGGMSKVYLAQDIKSGKKVAIKVLNESLSSDPEYIKRFKREIEISKTLNHPNIVRIISYGKDRDSYYIVYEYIEGQTLDKYIKSKKLSIKEIEDITLQILQGLSYAHSKGIIHRDIKPSNIMVSKGKVKILDFGIARATERSTITKTGMFMGSPHYISPEQADSKKLDHRTDIYSLGVVLYEMLTGKIPFDANTPWGIVHKHIYDKPPDINKIARNIPSNLSEVVNRCLSKKPQDRYSSAAEIISIIKHKEPGKPTVIVPVHELEPSRAKAGRPSLSRKLLVIIPITVAAIAVLSFIIYYFGLNHVPKITNISLSPDEPTTLDDITLTYDFVDQDNDKDSSQIRWYVNERHIGDYDDGSSIPFKLTTKGDKIYAEVVPNDSREDGETVKSQTITIENSPPTISNIKIIPEEPTDRDDIVLSYDYYDPDEDPDEIRVEWYINDNYIPELNNQLEILSSTFDNNDVIYSLITLNNDDMNNTVKSKEILVSRSLPNPTIQNNYNIEAWVDDVYLDDKYIYFTYNNYDLEDLGDNGFLIAANSFEDKGLEIISKYNSNSFARVISVNGKYIYLLTDNNIEIIDASIIEDLKLIGSYSIRFGYYYSFFSTDDHIFLSNIVEGTKILDVKSKNSPKVLNSFNVSGYGHSFAEDIFIDNDLAYIAQGSDGLYIIDVSDLQNISIVSNFNTEGDAWKIFIKDNFVYVLNRMWSKDRYIRVDLQIIDMNNPKNPYSMSNLELPGFATDIFVEDDFIYVANQHDYIGLQIIDIQDKENPCIINDIYIEGHPFSISIKDDYAYIACREGGLKIVKLFN
jgi:serine/threonine protein kinase